MAAPASHALPSTPPPSATGPAACRSLMSRRWRATASNSAATPRQALHPAYRGPPKAPLRNRKIPKSGAPFKPDVGLSGRSGCPIQAGCWLEWAKRVPPFKPAVGLSGRSGCPIQARCWLEWAKRVPSVHLSKGGKHRKSDEHQTFATSPHTGAIIRLTNAVSSRHETRRL
jgi:hypothetical protein